MSLAIELLTVGLVMGASQCMLSCMPMLALYVAGTKEGWREGLKDTLIFSISRLFAYVLLGFVAGFAGMFLATFLQDQRVTFYLWISVGSFVSLLGVLVMLGKEPHIRFCKILSRHTVADGTKSMALLGFIMGIAPCAPLMGVLTYIALSVKNPLLGAAYTFCFGVGAALITPIIIMGVFSSVAPRLLFKNRKILDIFRRSCGLLLIFLGVRLIVDVIS